MNAPMRRRTLVLLLVSNAVSVAGTRVSAVAIPWLVLVTTGSAAKTGIVAAAELAPMVLAKALSGPLVDRVGPRRVSVTADLASAALVGLVPLLHLLDLLSFGVLVGVVALVGAARGPGDTAKETLAPEVAEAAALPIERVTGLTATVDRSASIIAPGLAGLLIAGVGAANALAVDAASFLVCAAGIAACLPRRERAQPADGLGGPAEPYVAQLRAGLSFLTGDRLMRGLVLMLSATNLLDTAFNSVLLPTWIHSHGYGPAQLGLIGSTFGLFATFGAVLAAMLGTRMPRRTIYVVGFLVAGAPRWAALAFGAPIWLIVAICMVGGLGAGFINPILGAVFVERIPRHMLGRVNALAESLSWAGMPLGGLAAGAAVAGIGLVPVLAAGGVCYFVATTLPTRSPHWSEMDANRGSRVREPAVTG
jgi:MFS family permease